MNVRRGVGAFLVIAGTVVMWRAGLLMNQTRVLSAVDSQTLEDRVTSLEKRVTNLEGVSTWGKTPGLAAIATKTVKAVQKESYLRLLDGSAAAGNWTKIPGTDFWFDQSLYGNVSQVTWEGWLQVKSGNGVGYARLFDVANNRGVDGSEVKIVSNQRASFFSSPLAIWRGQNQYRVEVKSSTGYEVSISEARLKIQSR